MVMQYDLILCRVTTLGYVVGVAKMTKICDMWCASPYSMGKVY